MVAKRISNQDAKEVLLAAGLEPLEDYKGSKVRIKCIHKVCGNVCYPMLEKVKLGQIGCKPCRYKMVSEKLKLSEADAKKIMKDAGYIPLEPYTNALTKWKCKHIPCGTVVYPLLNQIQQGSGGCFSCGHIATGLKRRNSNSTVLEVLSANQFTLIGKYHGAEKKIRVRCEVCGNEIEAIFSVISRKSGRGCKPCAVNESRLRYRMDLNEVRSRLKASNMKLLGEYKNSNTPVACKCLKCGVVRNIRISVLLKGDGCRPCALAKAGKKRRTSEFIALEAMRKIGKVEPLEPYQNQNARWKSRCLTCGSIVYPRLGSITGRKGLGCEGCANKLRGIGKRVPQAKAFALFLRNDLIPLPDQNYVDAESRIDCIHACGKKVNTSYRLVRANMSKKMGSCKPCGAIKGANTQRFDISVIDKVYKSRGLTLVDRNYRGVQYKHQTSCNTCGHVWESTPSHVSLGTGCPNCAKGGVKPNLPGYIYLITHSELNAHKVGIANSAKYKLADRLYHHGKQGWVLVKRWDFTESRNIRTIEQQVFKILRKEMDIPPYLAKDDMPFGGWTETLSADAMSVTNLSKLIELEIAAATSN